MTLDQLARMAKECRDSQKAYFKARKDGHDPERLQALLIASKSLESMLDGAVAEVLNPPKPNLFS
jgi:hypothetical protein